MYPNQITPPIPEKKASKKTKRHLEKRMRILEFFLNDIVNIPEFLNNKYVQGFLSISDGPRFQTIKTDVKEYLFRLTKQKVLLTFQIAKIIKVK